MWTHYTQFPISFVDKGMIVSVGIALPLVCIICVILRFWTRKLQKLPTGMDDWLLIPACVLITGMGTIVLVASVIGNDGGLLPFAEPIDKAPPVELLQQTYLKEFKAEFLFQFLMIPVLGLVKLSIIFFFRRVFITHKRTAFDYITRILIGLISIWIVVVWVYYIARCFPADISYTELRHHPKFCRAGDQHQFVFLASDLTFEVVVILLPLPVIWNLRMSRFRKITIYCVFMFGILSVVASIIRIVSVVIFLQNQDRYDLARTVTTVLWWAMFEASIALIAACLPTMSYLVIHFQIGAKCHRAWYGLPSLKSRGWGSSSAGWSKFDTKYTQRPRQPTHDSGYSENIEVGVITSGESCATLPGVIQVHRSYQVESVMKSDMPASRDSGHISVCSCSHDCGTDGRGVHL